MDEMVRLILCGCNGRMGHAVTACAAHRCDVKIVAGFDINTESPAGFPVYANPQNCNVEADGIVDFSRPESLPGVLWYAQDKGIPAVIATTGLSDQDAALIDEAAKRIPVFTSANMSLGISLLSELARKAAKVLGNDFDIEIVEKHHNQKVDAPSGTALMLADAIRESLPYQPEYVFDRHAVRQKRKKEEIGFSSIRGGTIVGEHDIIFAGHDEVLTLSHAAGSRELFASGALSAILYLQGKPAGRYTMADLVKDA